MESVGNAKLVTPSVFGFPVNILVWEFEVANKNSTFPPGLESVKN